MSVLVGVGGTGQHVAISYLMLAWIADFDPVAVVIIDNNTQKSPKKDQHFAVTPAAHLAELATWWQWPPLRGWNLAAIHPVKDQARVRAKDAFSPDDRALLPHLLRGAGAAAGTEDSELDPDVSHGFYGIPRVGSLLAAEALTGSADVQAKVVSRLKSPNRDRVGIVGSLVGGAGAGIIPPLIRQLGSVTGARLYAALNLLTFELVKSAEEGPEEGLEQIHQKVVSVAEMKANQSAGLAQFVDELEKHCQRVVLLSLDDAYLDKVVWNGNREQKAQPLPLHILAATLQHLFLSCEEPKKPPAGPLQVFNSSVSGFTVSDLLLPNRHVRSHALPFEDDLTRYSTEVVPPEAEGSEGWFGGHPAAAVLSLRRWLWIARLQLELGRLARPEVEGGTWDFVYDLRDQIRPHRKKVQERLDELISRSNRALLWMRSALLDPAEGFKKKRRVVVDRGNELLDVLDLDCPPRHWKSAAGKRYADLLVKLDSRRLDDVLRRVAPKDLLGDEPDNLAAALIWRRLRDYVELGSLAVVDQEPA